VVQLVHAAAVPVSPIVISVMMLATMAAATSLADPWMHCGTIDGRWFAVVVAVKFTMVNG